MASFGKNRGPYEIDGNVYIHRGNPISTILHSEEFDFIIQNLEEAYEYNYIYISDSLEHRPDLISNEAYGTPKFWWLIMFVNGITDPFEGFNINDKIRIPVVK